MMSDKTRVQISNDAAHDTFRLAENEILRLREIVTLQQRTIKEQAETIVQARATIDHSLDDLRDMAIGGSVSRKMCNNWLEKYPA